jgi:hypothetical protein
MDAMVLTQQHQSAMVLTPCCLQHQSYHIAQQAWKQQADAQKGYTSQVDLCKLHKDNLSNTRTSSRIMYCLRRTCLFFSKHLAFQRKQDARVSQLPMLELVLRPKRKFIFQGQGSINSVLVNGEVY